VPLPILPSSAKNVTTDVLYIIAPQKAV